MTAPGPGGRRWLFVGAAAAVLAAALLSVCVGKYPIRPGEVLALLTGGGRQIPDMARRVFFTLRLPRTLMAVLAGAGLGTAGCVYQLVFKNPLASPDIIGVAGGANLGAALAIVLASSGGMLTISLGAFWGGFAAVLCVMLLTRFTGTGSTAAYVLAGIVINAVSKSAIMALKYFADPENELAAMEYWEMGTFGSVTLSKLLAVLPLFLAGMAGLLLLRRQVELLALGDNESRALGLRLRPVRLAVLLLSTLLVSSIVSVTGLISFVGLIAPHIARLMLRRGGPAALLLSGLVGSLVVLAADILARVLYSAELPISILTTVTGVPVLVYFMYQGRDRAL